MLKPLVLLILALPLLAQEGRGPARRLIYSASLPATCSPSTGDVYFKTAATIGPYYCSAANTWTAMGGGAVSAVLSINSDTSAAQIIAAGSAGTDFAIAESGATHTINCPSASATVRGCLTTTDWSTFNNKGAGTVTSVGVVGTANQITVTGASPITSSGSFTLSIPTNPTLPGTTSGTFSGGLTGNASTATALAANAANCSAGQFPLGVDASGAAESCTALPTTITGTANQITASGSTGPITLSIPTSPTLPGTTTGTFSGNITGNVTGNASGTAATITGALVAGNLAKQDIMDSPASCADAGATDTYACNLTPAITAYVTGTHYRFKANTVNTGAASINFNAVGAVTIVKLSGGSITAALADGDILAGQWVEMVYDGTNMQMESQVGNNDNTGSGASTRVAYWSGSHVLTSDLGFTFATQQLTLTRSNSGGVGGLGKFINSNSGLGTGSTSYVEVNAASGAGLTSSGFGHYYGTQDGGANTHTYLANGGVTPTEAFLSNVGGSKVYMGPGLFSLGTNFTSIPGSIILLDGRSAQPTKVVIAAGATQSTSALLQMTSNTGSTVYNAWGNAGVLATYNTEATASVGHAYIRGSLALTGQTGNIAAQTLLAVSHAAGLYKVCGTVSVTTTVAATTLTLPLTWRGPSSGSDTVQDMLSESGVITLVDGVSLTTAKEASLVCKNIRSTGATAITVDPSDASTGVYNLYATIERIQ